MKTRRADAATLAGYDEFIHAVLDETTSEPMTEPAHRNFLARQLTAPTLSAAIAAFVVGSLLTAQAVESWLQSRNLANQFVSTSSWIAWAMWFSGKPVLPTDAVVDVPYGSVLFVVLGMHALAWLIGSAILIWRRRDRWTSTLIRWGFYSGLWWCLVGLWDWVSLGAQMIGAESFVSFWALTPTFWCAGCLAGWMTTWLMIGNAAGWANRQANGDASSQSALRTLHSAFSLWSFIAVYIAVFVTMNWRLYFNLLIPHGDSAMYEEHLWNLLHGKGFRSYLDQGLFLGEHIQIAHLGLIPLYVFWPSHLLLELCESLALALGAWPVYWMTRRHTGSQRAALAAAAAYLLYPPMQFLDIEIDLKTFRPEAFGIPILLLTLDQLDRRHLWGTLIGIVGCFTVKEDYAVVLAPLGLWIAVFEGGRRKSEGGRLDRRWMIFGLAVAIGSVAYLYVATRIVMPWFRSGAEIHYANYFSKFGKTPEEILRTMLTQPGLLFEELFSTSTVLYALAMLAPLAFVPLLSPSRLAVGLPLFGILCLNELPQSRTPQHQFHAALVPILFWALAGAWPRGIAFLSRIAISSPLAPAPGERGGALPEPIAESSAARTIVLHAVWTSSLAMTIFFSLNPLSLTFWDAGSEMYWRKLYGPTQRAAEFAKIADLIPQSARVASTDFVHPRYTHCERSYDYSNYARKVSDNERKVPDDTDYIVIDTQHRYSKMKVPRDVPEYRDHPDEWELLPDKTDGYFIVLKRRRG